MSTSQKHRNFVMEPMSLKPVTEIAGIGEVLGSKLINKGFYQAYMLLGQFLIMQKDVNIFGEWLKFEIKANAKQAFDCSQCLEIWCNTFIKIRMARQCGSYGIVHHLIDMSAEENIFEEKDDSKINMLRI
ncbi:hypothetical protein A3Q56_05645, partial [Intoshia linei]